MGAHMNKCLDGLYVGNIRDSKDKKQLEQNKITHILSIHDNANEGHYQNIEYLCIRASDSADQDLQQYFKKCNTFIHKARLEGGNVLVHCLAGISRSTTICIAYIMTVTNLSWTEAMNSVRGSRKGANPNFGFQRQLQNYEKNDLQKEKAYLLSEFGKPFNPNDHQFALKQLEVYNERLTLELNYNSNDNDNSTNIAVKSNGEKNYPLPYNAYNLDSKKTISKRDELNQKPKADKLREEEDADNDKIDKFF